MVATLGTALLGAAASAGVNKLIGGGSQAAGSYVQGRSAEAAAEGLQPYSQLGRNAAEGLHRTYFGQGDNLSDFYGSPEFELNQFGLQQGAKDLGYGLSAQGRVPFDASGNLTSGAGMRAYQQGMTGLYGGLYDRWKSQMNQMAGAGQNAAVGQGGFGMDAGTAYGMGIGSAGQAVGSMFGNQTLGNVFGGTPVQAPVQTFSGGSAFGGFT